jgi:hypothetical protein
MYIIPDFRDMIKGISDSFRFDISNSKVLLHVISSASLFFSYSGISLSISRKILKYVEKQFPQGHQGYHNYLLETARLFYDLASGHWERPYEEESVERGLYYGDLFDVSAAMLFWGNIFVEQGCFTRVEHLLKKFETVADEFNDPFVKYNWKTLGTHYLLKTRRLSEATFQAREADVIGYKLGFDVDRVNVLGMKLQAEMIKEDTNAAELTLQTIEELLQKEEFFLPQYYMSYQIGLLRLLLSKLIQATQAGQLNSIETFRERALQSARKALKYNKKYVLYETELYRLLGKLYSFLGDKRASAKWFQQSLNSGTRLGAEVETARTCLEICRHLNDQLLPTSQLNGLSASRYLEQAREIFQRYYLNWDLLRVEHMEEKLRDNK